MQQMMKLPRQCNRKGGWGVRKNWASTSGVGLEAWIGDDMGPWWVNDSMGLMVGRRKREIERVSRVRVRV